MTNVGSIPEIVIGRNGSLAGVADLFSLSRGIIRDFESPDRAETVEGTTRGTSSPLETSAREPPRKSIALHTQRTRRRVCLQHYDVVISIDYVERREIVISVNKIFRSCLNGTKIARDIHVSAVSLASGRRARSKELTLSHLYIAFIKRN